MTNLSECKKCGGPIEIYYLFPLCDVCLSILDEYVEANSHKYPNNKVPDSDPILRKLMGLKPKEEKLWN